MSFLDRSNSPPFEYRYSGPTLGWIKDFDLSVTTALFESRAIAASMLITSTTSVIQTFGYAASGDGGGATYKRVGGSTPGGFQSADGSWWALAEIAPNVRQFGAVGDDVTDDRTAFVVALAYLKTLSPLQSGDFRTTPSLYIPTPSKMYFLSDTL